ncbi:hypothetical protein ONS95_004228 [Cadophora gregata]|uniref:uncharacterized protein n=1 Tax=Cadophora gregata TaxID=51156 RepID=UPI0026DC0A3E|nr:uncharacterized protein ONS95_004228 [Cadophora gregata]KAK0105703.1 hypothetical protein ONS95_004228 [Cadophora gregata]
MSSMDMDVPARSGSSGTEMVGIRQMGLRACGTCVKAKVKCVPNPQKGKCNRCHRLNKICQPSSTPTKKRPTHVAHLERKLDTLVELLSGPNREEQRSGSSSSPPKSPAAPHRLRIMSPPSNITTSTESPRFSPQNFVSNNSSSHVAYDSYVAQPQVYNFDFENREASFLLLEYRTQQASQLPFVVIPPDATSESLRRERPMLWKAIMTAASYQYPLRQEALGWKLMEEFASRIMLRAEKSLDLLQALLVHLTWYHYHSVANPQVLNLLSLARTLAVNLGYHRTHTPKGRPKIWLDGPDGVTKQQYDPEESVVTSRTLEEWRALAGCFFLSAITTSSCRRNEPVQYTQHLDHICRTLTELREYESDLLIFPLISVQNVVLKISTAFTDPNLGLSTAPVKMFIQSLHTELQNIRQNMSLNAAEDFTFVVCFQMAEISLFEVSLYRSFHLDSDKAYHLNLLYSCLTAVKTFFDSHFSNGSPFATSFAYFRWIFAGYVLILGAKLAAYKTEGWDTRHVHEVLDCANALDRVIGKFEAILQRRTPHGEYEIFDRYVQQMRRVKAHGKPSSRSQPRTQSGNPLCEGREPHQSPQAGSRLHQTSFDPEMSQLNSNPFTIEPDDNFWQTMFDGDDDWFMTPY